MKVVLLMIGSVFVCSPAFEDCATITPEPTPTQEIVKDVKDWKLCYTDVFEGHGNCESKNAWCCEG